LTALDGQKLVWHFCLLRVHVSKFCSIVVTKGSSQTVAPNVPMIFFLTCSFDQMNFKGVCEVTNTTGLILASSSHAFQFAAEGTFSWADAMCDWAPPEDRSDPCDS